MALLSGLTLGGALFLSYGLALMAIPVFAVAVLRRRIRTLVVAAVGVAVVVIVFYRAGFWWLDGLHATAHEYAVSIAKTRPYEYFLVADVAVFGLIAGPATMASLPLLRFRTRPSSGAGATGSTADRDRWWLVPALGLTVLALADLSGFSKAEVERIWLFLVPPVVAATAFLARPGLALVRRGWLGLQVAAGLVLEVALRNPW